MEALASVLVGNPFGIAAIAAMLAALHLALAALTRHRGYHAPPWHVAAGAFMAYALWEWLVNTRSPDANIRFDLLLIWPVLGVLLAWAMFRTLRPRRRHTDRIGARSRRPAQ